LSIEKLFKEITHWAKIGFCQSSLLYAKVSINIFTTWQNWQVMSSNLWDECGNGNIDNFHTTWLRRLLKSLNKDNDIIEYRKTKPWFTSITSNSLNSLLTTVGGVYRAYGHFLITESWVAPHFTKMLIGMETTEL
jgi:hypothetical protein